MRSRWLKCICDLTVFPYPGTLIMLQAHLTHVKLCGELSYLVASILRFCDNSNLQNVTCTGFLWQSSMDRFPQATEAVHLAKHIMWWWEQRKDFKVNILKEHVRYWLICSNRKWVQRTRLESKRRECKLTNVFYVFTQAKSEQLLLTQKSRICV